ncbi:MAG: 4Fe-4S dicluster domain-containing protein [Anaerolineales bacterium]|nr:4Fe-4S dicluster domain-containing protein [Anaerolineales bacterium]
MLLKILSKSDLPDAVERLGQRYRIIAPMLHEGQTVFKELLPGDAPDMEYRTTPLPPKKALLPPREELIQLQSTNGESRLEPVLDVQPAVLLGVHTCDLHAIGLLDKVFTEGVPDQHYINRRRLTKIISLECLEPCSEHSFCKSMGTLAVPESFDLHLTDLGSDYAVEIGSKAGLNLLWKFFTIRDAGDDDYARLNKAMSEKWSRFNYRLDIDATELPGLMSLNYADELWEELGQQCLSCGACNLVCPTCFCFDVQDEIDVDLRSGVRTRVWDSCQLARFALVAGGHNFRIRRGDRLRHRFMRKGKYIQEMYDRPGCVGCGRCAQACPVDIKPLDVFNRLAAGHVNQSEMKKEAIV